MIKKLLLFLVVITYLQNIYSQQGEADVQTFFSNAGGNCGPNSIIVRIALRNNTSNTVQLAGIRFGIQFDSTTVTLTGIKSYMNNGAFGPGLDDNSYLSSPIGPDSGPLGDYESPAKRTANITGGGQKTMTMKYFNRSTNICANTWELPPHTYRVAVDFCFQLVPPKVPADYGLDASPWGYGTGNFISQILTSPTADLDNSKKEIGIYLKTGAQDQDNPYQPFDLNNCRNLNINPFTIGDGVNFISPDNGILSGKIERLTAEERNDHVLLDWNVENNELVDHYEIERKEENGSFRTIGMIMSDNKNSTTQYQFNDKITARDLKLYYRVKTVGEDQVITYSDIKMVRPGSVQQNTVKVFPNPASDLIRFNAPLLNGYYVCRIYSNEGRMVMTANVSSANTSINIKNLKTGSYFIEIYSPQNDKRFYSQFSKF